MTKEEKQHLVKYRLLMEKNRKRKKAEAAAKKAERARIAALTRQGVAAIVEPPPPPPPISPELASADENLVEADFFETETVTTTLRVSDEVKLSVFGKVKGLFSSYYTTTRYGIALKIIKTEVRIETVSDGVNRVSADTGELGPKGSNIAWSALVALLQFCVGIHLPINRVAKMLGTCLKFNSRQICRWLRQVADWMLPIYLHLAAELAEADILTLDDSPTKVLQMKAKIEARTHGTEAPEDLDPLVASVADMLGRTYKLVKGEGLKKVVNCTIISGRSNSMDPRSTISFYRSHYGDGRDLLESLLSMRRPKNRDLTILSDLSSRVHPSDKYKKLFDIKIAGCTSHARRDIWRHKEDDDELCDYLLRAFAILSSVEDYIDRQGRTVDNTLRIRRRHAKKIWALIIAKAASVVNAPNVKEYKGHKLWPQSSDIWKACRYIVKNQKELTRYLDNARLDHTNNRMERLLRAEVMLRQSCKFRKSEAGRVVFDILRTIMMTVRIAKVPLAAYIRWVYRNRKEIESKPAAYTPYAYHLYLGRQSPPLSSTTSPTSATG